MPVHDRLGQAGGARREQHVQRGGERHALELQRAGFGDEVGPGLRPVGVDRVVVEVRQPDDGVDALQPGPDGLDLGATVDGLVAVPVAVDGEQQLRLDLLPPVDDALHAELRRARAEHRTQAGRGQHQHQRLGDVRCIGGDPVAGTDAEAHESEPGPGHLVAQLGGGQANLVARLRAGDDHDVVVGTTGHPQHRLGVVEPDIGKPLGARHRFVGQDRRRIAVRRHVDVRPHGRPEGVEVVDRPAPQVLVGVEDRPTAVAHRVGELVQTRAVARRTPEDRHRRPVNAGSVGRRRTSAHGTTP